jgi:hypothetical protein
MAHPAIIRSDAVRYRCCLCVSTMLFAAAVAAQTVPPASSRANDSWGAHPAVAASVSGYRSHAPLETPPAKQHFKFKRREPSGPMSQPPPSANDKAAVMGADRPWQSGRPPIDCAQTPMDPTCHH